MELTKKDNLVLLAALYAFREDHFGTEVSEEEREFVEKHLKDIFGERVFEEDFEDEILKITNKHIDFLFDRLRALSAE